MTNDTPPDRRVLVIEDDERLCELYAEWLQSDYEVVTAYSGEIGLLKLDASIDIVLLDRGLPGLDGDDLLGRIAQQGYAVRIGVVSGSEPDADLPAGIGGYLVKPVGRDQFRAFVDELAAQPPASHEDDDEDEDDSVPRSKPESSSGSAGTEDDDSIEYGHSLV